MKSLILFFVLFFSFDTSASALNCQSMFRNEKLTLATTYTTDANGYMNLKSNVIIKLGGTTLFNVKADNVRIYNDDREVIALHYLNLKSNENFYIRYGIRGSNAVVLKFNDVRRSDIESQNFNCDL